MHAYFQSFEVIEIRALVIIIGKRAVFETQPSLEDSARFDPVFTSLNFATTAFFYSATSSALRPTPKLEDQVPTFTSPSDRVAQLCSVRSTQSPTGLIKKILP
jgi:hypothetical protein